jgi:hypothetical protein
MSDGADIYLALMAKVSTLAVGSPALPIAYPEQQPAFDPATDAPDGKYIEVSDFPNRPRWEGLASGQLKQGLLQITVIWPKNDGLVRPKAAADEVMAHFAKGTVLVSGTAKVKISAEPWQAAPLSEDSEVRVPVTIPWTA